MTEMLLLDNTGALRQRGVPKRKKEYLLTPIKTRLMLPLLPRTAQQTIRAGQIRIHDDTCHALADFLYQKAVSEEFIEFGPPSSSVFAH